MIHISTRKDGIETKKKILTVCVQLFLEQGYKNTSVSQIVDEAGVARGSYLNLFPTKDRILLELTETMFGGQFGVARSIADSKLPPVYAYAVETAIQLTLTELNDYLADLNEQTEALFSRLVKQLSEKEGVTEALKAEHLMLWVQKMNSIRNTAMEVVSNDLIYA